jgi:hypothetical protein
MERALEESFLESQSDLSGEDVEQFDIGFEKAVDRLR